MTVALVIIEYPDEGLGADPQPCVLEECQGLHHHSDLQHRLLHV